VFTGEDAGAFVRWEIEDNKDLAANYKVFLAQGQATAADKDRFEQVADFSGSEAEVENNPGGRAFAYYMVNLTAENACGSSDYTDTLYVGTISAIDEKTLLSLVSITICQNQFKMKIY
jgi:hypothetical protein